MAHVVSIFWPKTSLKTLEGSKTIPDPELIGMQINTKICMKTKLTLTGVKKKNILERN